MKGLGNRWDVILLAEVIFTIFFTGFFPFSWHQNLFMIMYLVIYFTAIANLDQNRKAIVLIAFVSVIFTGLARVWSHGVIEAISVCLDIAFFAFIVISLIRQIARAHIVSERVILQAINGYLLLGIAFTFLIALTIQFDSQSFNFSADPVKQYDILYYGFITFTTTGYGDLLPLKPWSKSLAVLVATCGQLYVAIIIALLVGKFSSQAGRNN